MSIPKKTPTAPTITDKTPEIAQEIYDMMITTGNITATFKALNYPMVHIKAVLREVKRMEAAAIAFVQANPECSAANVLTAIASNWLDEATVGGDIVKYNPTYNPARTFAEFKAEYLPAE